MYALVLYSIGSIYLFHYRMWRCNRTCQWNIGFVYPFSFLSYFCDSNMWGLIKLSQVMTDFEREY